jgi:hypothetical protein
MIGQLSVFLISLLPVASGEVLSYPRCFICPRGMILPSDRQGPSITGFDRSRPCQSKGGRERAATMGQAMK